MGGGLHVCPFIFGTSFLIFMKLDLNMVPLDSTSTLINCNFM